jgi:hypothetical protein
MVAKPNFVTIELQFEASKSVDITYYDDLLQA